MSERIKARNALWNKGNTAADRRAYFGPPVVKWNRGLDGGTTSKDGRFSIQALYEGTCSAQGYELFDTKTGKRTSADNQYSLKLEADKIVKAEIAMIPKEQGNQL